MDSSDPLNLFLPPVRRWFRTTLGEPTPAQRLGWPAIAAGKHTLILAPTGSGKTLAAFLACLDQLWRESLSPLTPTPLPQGEGLGVRGVRVLYVSPLKALNNDIYRNLQVPLEGVTAMARQMGQPLPVLEAAVRTGDTPAAERQRLLRRPPHILITTPESLHLLLTSRARDILRPVTHCIVDEIHALCPNKRGVFLALLLERLAALTPNGFVRIGLSATQRPLDEVARYLGGSETAPDGRLVPREVAVVDAGLRKNLDLRVVSPVEQFGPLPEKTIWPSICRLLGDEVRRHRSTIIFANSRRVVERITANLNETEEVARAHHGSVSLEVRQQTEQALKEGRLPAVVATASLELGIDMGAVDLVCQVESPGNVARALQRVGRAGHLVGQTSKGRLIPKTLGDLLEQAVLAREMAAGRVEEMRVPINCLDVLAQQVVAMTAMESWDVPALYALVRRAYPYRDLSPQAFETVLEMISGRYRFQQPGERGALAPRCTERGALAPPCTDRGALAPPCTDRGASAPQCTDRGADAPRSPASPLAALQPRVSWDRVHNRLHALPGSKQLALVNGGTIPDTGQFAAYARNGVRIGELDEEFIYERRIGDVFLLGTNAWRLERIDADRVIVAPAEGMPALVPFWRGEQAGRSPSLGLAMGQFLRELADRIDQPDCLDWLKRECFLDPAAARNLRGYVVRQLLAAGCLPTDRTLVVEASRDQLGDWQVILLSPLGGRLHLTLRLALAARLRQRLGYAPQCLHHDDGILLRLADTDEPILDLFDGLTPENVEGLILEELADSALFALRFRQNAARALLLPRVRPDGRAPLWLQRLRGRDLLQVARRHPDFPIVVETFRECLHDHLDLPRLKQLLADIRAGQVQVTTRRAEAPSPFAAGLLFAFTAAYMYEFDRTESERGPSSHLDRHLLEQLVTPDRHSHLLDPRAVHQVERRLRGLGRPPRTAAEMAEWLRRLGDLAPGELEGPMEALLHELANDGRAKEIELPTGGTGAALAEPRRWILAEEEGLYRRAFGLEPAEAAEAQAAGATILGRFLDTHALVSLGDVLGRYPFEPAWAERQLEEWARAGRLVAVPPAGELEPLQWSAPANLEQVQRGTLALLRREVVTCPAPQFADFLLRWQGLHPDTRRGTSEGLAAVLERLQGFPLPAELWEQTVLPGRVPGYQPRWLDEQIAGGQWVWVCQGDSDSGPGLLAFWDREHLAQLPPPAPAASPFSSAGERSGDEGTPAERVLDVLVSRGASFVTDLAQQTGLAPSAVRAALWNWLRRGLVTNDHFDVIRKGEQRDGEMLRSEGPASRLLSRYRPAARPPRHGSRPEGRWSLIPWGRPTTEAHAVFQASVLLQRYGVVARELALLDPWMLPWRILYEVLSRMELAGDVRRGYFVEGLSGAQFALPEAARLLQELDLPSTAAAPVVLLHSLDPANLYGSGAPFDIPLLDGGTRPLVRRAGNWLVLRAGRPVLLIELQGRRLTALASASRDDVAAAVACLPGILDRNPSVRHKLTVEEWNGRPVTTTEGRELLEAAGFVRDYQGMTLYAAWR
ncbi:MAG TPA: DEAD/DEAH box helicase [Gemmataceae bacterium]|nr:DEAD/DEAH box helicase [Gemmataceae bacterium]